MTLKLAWTMLNGYVGLKQRQKYQILVKTDLKTVSPGAHRHPPQTLLAAHWATSAVLFSLLEHGLLHDCIPFVQNGQPLSTIGS